MLKKGEFATKFIPVFVNTFWRVVITRLVASPNWPLVRVHVPSVRTCSSSRTKQDYYSSDQNVSIRSTRFRVSVSV